MRSFLALAVATAVAALLVAVSGIRTDAAPARLAIATLSSRADMVSGGDALVEIRAGSSAPTGVTVKVNDRDVTAVFRVNAERQSLIGLVEGLVNGRNTIAAQTGSQTARLDITNYPITGPIFSGEHLKPFLCNTVQSGLGEPLDADCSAKTKVEYFYKSRTPSARDRAGRCGGRVQGARCFCAAACRHRRNHHQHRQNGSLHRARRIGDHQPFDLSDCDPR